MQILQEVQKNFSSLGFNPELKPFNRKISGILTMTILGVISLWIFFIREADRASEYMESIYMITTCTGVLISFTSTVFIEQKLFSFIKSVEKFGNESELNFNDLNIERFTMHISKLKTKISDSETSRTVFEKTNELVEKWTRIGMFMMKNVFIPCAITLEVTVSFFIYFTTDAGNDAFDLPFPMW